MMQRYRFAKILAVNTAFYWFSLIETLLTPKSRPRSWTVPNSELGFMKQPRRMRAIRPFSPLIRNWCLYSADPVPTRSTFIQGAPWNTWFFEIYTISIRGKIRSFCLPRDRDFFFLNTLAVCFILYVTRNDATDIPDRRIRWWYFVDCRAEFVRLRWFFQADRKACS